MATPADGTIRYYAVYSWGRRRLLASNDEDAVEIAELGPGRLLRVVKTSETIIYEPEKLPTN